MNECQLQTLIDQYQTESKGLFDYKKYSYYAATHHSTAIEGCTLSQAQVINFLAYGKSVSTKPLEEHQMVYDHFQAMLFVMKLANDKTPHP